MLHIGTLFYIILSLFCGLVANAAEPAKIDSAIFDIKPRDYVYGNDDAKIEVIEYFSLTCPHCENFFVNIFPELKKEYIDTGKVKWIKRSFVTDSSSLKGTMLLYCVDKPDFEKYLRILLNKQSSWAYNQDPLPILKNIALLGGISSKKFSECMGNKELSQEITVSANEATRTLKLTGTPAFFINHEKVTLYTLKSFKDHLDKLLLAQQ